MAGCPWFGISVVLRIGLTATCASREVKLGNKPNRYCGRPFGTNLYGSTSGTTRTWVVNLKGGDWFALGKVSSTKNAVQPFGGSGTFAR